MSQVLEYQNCAKRFAKKLLEVLLKGLNVNKINESLERLLMETMSININYYPPCPNFSMPWGLTNTGTSIALVWSSKTTGDAYMYEGLKGISGST